MKVLDHYDDYFAQQYGENFPKLGELGFRQSAPRWHAWNAVCADMVALPQFISGAMENWGLVTYRETTMLYNNSSSQADTELNVARVVSHELAHMVRRKFRMHKAQAVALHAFLLRSGSAM